MILTTRALGRSLSPCFRSLSLPRSSVAPQRVARSLFFSTTDNEESHRLFREQMMDLKEEREALFGFTEEDQQAWKNNGDKIDQAFLDQINSAREEVFLASKQQQPLSKSKTTETIQTERVQESDISWSYSSVTPASPSPDVSAGFTHISPAGDGVSMVDVGHKEATVRIAVAQSRVVFPSEVMEAFRRENDELVGPKGPIFSTAKIAGILAAK